jgi:hypothetical protein
LGALNIISMKVFGIKAVNLKIGTDAEVAK